MADRISHFFYPNAYVHSLPQLKSLRQGDLGQWFAFSDVPRISVVALGENIACIYKKPMFKQIEVLVLQQN